MAVRGRLTRQDKQTVLRRWRGRRDQAGQVAGLVMGQPGGNGCAQQPGGQARIPKAGHKDGRRFRPGQGGAGPVNVNHNAVSLGASACRKPQTSLRKASAE
jgi:hypothetical protein